MQDDDSGDGPSELSDSEIELVQGGGVRFGEYAVISPGVHITLDGRQVSHPGE